MTLGRIPGLLQLLGIHMAGHKSLRHVRARGLRRHVGLVEAVAGCALQLQSFGGAGASGLNVADVFGTQGVDAWTPGEHFLLARPGALA